MNELPPEVLLQPRRPRPLLWALCWVGFYLFLTVVLFLCDWIPYAEGPPMSYLDPVLSVAGAIQLFRVSVFGAGLGLAAPILGMRMFRADSARRRIVYALWLTPLALILLGQKPMMELLGFRKHVATRMAARDAQPLVHAIRSYRTDHGEPPASLGDLVPDYMEVLPTPTIRAAMPYEYFVKIEERGPTQWFLRVPVADRVCSTGERIAEFNESTPFLEREHRTKDGLLSGWTFACP